MSDLGFLIAIAVTSAVALFVAVNRERLGSSVTAITIAAVVAAASVLQRWAFGTSATLLGYLIFNTIVVLGGVISLRFSASKPLGKRLAIGVVASLLSAPIAGLATILAYQTDL